MREFIKKGIREKLGVEAAKVEAPETVPNETIVEYASLFPELDKLTMEGTVTETRELDVEVPLDKTDDDVELESIEYNIADGKVGDVRGSNTAQEVAESYEVKTYDSFYQEATRMTTRFQRESESKYEARVKSVADKMYEEYCTEARAAGLPGFDLINIADEKVPSKMNVNFGSTDDSNDNFVSRVNVFFATDKDHNITQKQLDSASLVKSGGIKNMGRAIKTYMESHYSIDQNTDIWDVVTPKTLIVPKGNADSFCVVVEFVNEITGKKEYFGWTDPIKTDDETIQESFVDDCEKYNMHSFAEEDHFENHDKYIQEAAKLKALASEVAKRRVIPSRFFKEAVEGLDDAPATDAPTEGGETADTEGGDVTEVSEEPKEVAAVNDVSAEIAEKVANDTQNDAMTEDEQITFSDETNPESNINVADGGDVDEISVEGDDTSTTDDSAAVDADAELAELDDMSGDGEVDVEEDTGEDVGDEIPDTGDIDNMSVNQLLELGKESLKDMKVGELKDLIQKGDNEAITEAFILTPKNVCKEIDIKLRECLGILNSNEDSVDKLLLKFRNKGHKLNRTLSKAIKMKKVFSSDECESIKKLNSALADLLLALRKKPENYASAIKTKILAFNKEAKVVGAIVEDKLNVDVTQEAFVQEGLFLSAGNAKKRLARKVAPVYADMGSIVKSAEGGVLNKGKINKMYKPAKKTKSTAWEAGDSGGLGFSSSREVDINTPHSENINDLQRILSKIIRKPKVQVAFTSDEMTMISDVTDLLDDFVDMVESVIYDANSDNQIIVEKIGEIAKKIMDLLQKINDVCTSTPIDSTKGMNSEEDVPVPEGEPLEDNDDVETEENLEDSSEETPSTGDDEEDIPAPEDEDSSEEEDNDSESAEDDKEAEETEEDE